MKPENPLDWETISSRVTYDTTGIDEPPPFGLATHVVAHWREQQRESAMQRWGLWSLRAALASVTGCVIFIIFHDRPVEPKLLLEPPSADWITPPLSTP